MHEKRNFVMVLMLVGAVVWTVVRVGIPAIR